MTKHLDDGLFPKKELAIYKSLVELQLRVVNSTINNLSALHKSYAFLVPSPTNYNEGAKKCYVQG